MRIISGLHRGRRFTPPRHIPARPTTDYAKEGLFNILQNNVEFDELKCLDLFAGTGNISYELASRGSTDLTCVELDTPSVKFIQSVAEKLDMNIQVLQMDVFEFIRKTKSKFNFIFSGPPYKLDILDSLPNEVFEHELLEKDGWLVLEHNPLHSFDDHPNFRHKRNYGTTIFSIFINN